MTKPLDPSYFNEIIQFANKHIGLNYFSQEDLEKIYSRSLLKGECCSFVHFEDNRIVAIRLAYMPGSWTDSPEVVIHPDLWLVDQDKVGYFKSLFVDPSFQGQGLGSKLSSFTIEAFKKVGGLAVVTHSWKESPNNSSYLYLSKLDFSTIKEIPLAWNHIDYECVRCGPQRCVCSALEMIKRL